MSTHEAAVINTQGARLEVAQRPTPAPGPNDILIEVAAVALNPIDVYQRDYGFPPLTHSPAIIGSDIGGIIKAVGSAAPSFFKPGTRVTAFAQAFYTGGAPDYGAFQELALVPSSLVAPIPESISFTEASLLPMSFLTSFSGFHTTLALPRDIKYTPADKQGLLIWGGGSSIGSGGIQIAKSWGYVLYVTASKKHHEYLRSLGADRLFDYHDEDVVEQIVKAAKADGVTVPVAYSTADQVPETLQVVKQLKGDAQGKVAAAKRLPEDLPLVEGVTAKFIQAPADERERTEHFAYVFNVWLKDKLEKGAIVPSPKAQVIGKGLEALNPGLDELKKGVSGVKLVVEL